VSDQYEALSSLSFPALASALGIDINDYNERKHGQKYHGPCPIHNSKQNRTSFLYAAEVETHPPATEFLAPAATSFVSGVPCPR
jgi:hypothetical protein